ncbi:MAG: hypothetical protein NVS3B10_27320 [Polyangiales bacterium]
MTTLARFLGELEVPWHSDHLCFSVAHRAATHDLLPLPFNQESVEHLVRRIREAQDRLPVPLAIENVSYYVTPPGSDLDEGEFVDAVVRESGCALMLDVNNVFVNAANHGHDPKAILARMPLDRVVQIHVAGHDYEEPPVRGADGTMGGGFILDTHAQPVRDEVYELLAWTLERTGKVPILLERDDDFPAFDVLLAEVNRLDAIWQAAPERPRLPTSANESTSMSAGVHRAGER